MGELRERLLEKFYFDADDGVLRHLSAGRGKQQVGSIAGSVNGHGYLQIRLDGKMHKIHRLVWLCHFGELPQGNIDHINGDKTDNRICNLRVCTVQQNSFNVGRNAINTSGLKGVGINGPRGGWMARVKGKGKNHRKSGFETKELAYEFACLLRDVLHGEFAKH